MVQNIKKNNEYLRPGRNGDGLDFLSCDPDIRRKLLTPISFLEPELDVRSTNVAKKLHLLVIGDLAQVTASNLLMESNVGRKTFNRFEDILQTRGLHLGLRIENWPNPNEVQHLLEERLDEGIDESELPNAPHSCVEDELLAVVDLVVPRQYHKIIIARTRWNGGQAYTLDQVGVDPNLSGLGKQVTRERIRQLEAKALAKIRGRKFVMPMLDKAMSCITEVTPIEVTRVPETLKNAGLSRTGMGASRLRFAVETFGKSWGLESSRVNGLEFLFRNDQRQTMCNLDRVILQASQRDFICVSDLENLTFQDDESPGELIGSYVDIDPRLEWLNSREGIFWVPPPFKRQNKIVFVCQKLFSVVDEMPLERLAAALKRARTVKSVPSREVLEAILSSRDDFTVENQMIGRAEGVKFFRLNRSDLTVLDIFKEFGPILNYTFLRNSLVRKGLPSNCASVFIVNSPFIYSISRGRYRCVADAAQIANVLDDFVSSDDELNHSDQDTVVEFIVTARHLTIGTHRMSVPRINAGIWSVVDEENRDLGTIEFSGKKLSGLKDVFSRMSVCKGDEIIFSFDQDSQSATLKMA